MYDGMCSPMFFIFFSGGFPGIDFSGITGRSYEAYQRDGVPRALALGNAWELKLIGCLRTLSHCSDRVWMYTKWCTSTAGREPDASVHHCPVHVHVTAEAPPACDGKIILILQFISGRDGIGSIRWPEPLIINKWDRICMVRIPCPFAPAFQWLLTSRMNYRRAA